MASSGILICLYQEHIPNLVEVIGEIAKSKSNYDMVITSITNPLYYREFDNDTQHMIFTRSELILESFDWFQRVIPKFSDYIDCDSADANIRAHSEYTLQQEMSFTRHLSQAGCSMIRLKGGRSLSNLARIINVQKEGGCILIEIPMIDYNKFKIRYRGWEIDDEGNAGNCLDTWHWWNKIRFYTKLNKRIRIALEMTDELPSEKELIRWLGEPVEMVIIPTNLFLIKRINGEDKILLKNSARNCLGLFIDRLNVHLAVKTSFDNPKAEQYAEALADLIESRKKNYEYEHLSEYEDQLMLIDNTQHFSSTINKTQNASYQQAIERVLNKKLKENGDEDKVATIILIDDRYGQLIQTVLNASQNTNFQIKLFIIEENLNDFFRLEDLVKQYWPNKDITVINNIESNKFSIKADVLITNLPDSSCYAFKQIEIKIDRLKDYLASNVSVIPAEKTLFICPIMAHNLTYKLNTTEPICDAVSEKTLNGLKNDTERIYQVLLKHFYLISEPREFTTIDYNKCNENMATSRSKNESKMSVLKYDIEQDCVLNGFIGYFETRLCDNIVLKEEEKSNSGSRWFPAYFPLNNLQQLRKGDELEINFWLCLNCSKNSMWFEWCTNKPILSFIHNQNGDTCSKIMF